MWFRCDKVCQWLAAGRWFFQGTPVSSTIKTGRIKLTVTKQDVYCFVSTVGNTSYLTTSTLNTKYIWAVLIKLHDSATYDDGRKSYEWLKHQALKCNLSLWSLTFSHFHLFFWNHKTDLNQTWQKCSLDGHIQIFCFWRWSEIQHGCQGP